MRFLPREAGHCSGIEGIIRGRTSKPRGFLKIASCMRITRFRGVKDMDELFEKMKKLIADKLEIDEGKISMDASFRQDLGADSLDTYELVYAIEEEMGISIPDEKANEFETVRDAYEYIKSQQK
jgi:acyl carrier protein